MRSFYLLAVGLLLTSCAAEHAAESLVPADQVFTAAGLPADSGRAVSVVVLKGKYKGPVNITVQQGPGNTATQTALTKPKGPVASAPAAVASATKEAGTAWYWFLLVAIGGAVGWEWLSHQVNPLSWLPWRVKSG